MGTCFKKDIVVVSTKIEPTNNLPSELPQNELDRALSSLDLPLGKKLDKKEIKKAFKKLYKQAAEDKDKKLQEELIKAKELILDNIDQLGVVGGMTEVKMYAVPTVLDKMFLFSCLFGSNSFELNVKDLLELHAAITEETELRPGAYVIHYKSNGKDWTLKTQNSFSAFTSKQPNAGVGYEIRIVTIEEEAKQNREAEDKEVNNGVPIWPDPGDIPFAEVTGWTENKFYPYLKAMEGYLVDGKREGINHCSQKVQVTGKLYKGELIGQGTWSVTEKNVRRVYEATFYKNRVYGKVVVRIPDGHVVIMEVMKLEGKKSQEHGKKIERLPNGKLSNILWMDGQQIARKDGLSESDLFFNPTTAKVNTALNENWKDYVLKK